MKTSLVLDAKRRRAQLPAFRRAWIEIQAQVGETLPENAAASR
jgi:hypothetical protein